MKRAVKIFGSMLLTLCLCLVILSPAALAEQGVEGYVLQSLVVDSAKATATVRLRAQEESTLLVALYDQSGKLLEVKSCTVTGTQEQELKLADYEGYSCARAFLTKNGKPLCDALTVFRWEEEMSDLPQTWQEELRYADELGLSMEQLGQQTVSGVEMTALLDAMVSLGAPEKLQQWQSMLPEFRSYEGALTRFDVMGSLMVAAETMGGRWPEPLTSLYSFSSVWTDLDFQFDDSFFTPQILDEVGGQHYLTPLRPGELAYLDSACLCFNLQRPSPISGEFPIAYDEENQTIYEDVPPDYMEALLAVTRMIAGTEMGTAGEEQEVQVLTAEKDAELQRALQEAIAEILATETEIVHDDTFVPGETYTGTAYYVSADGSDDNDGLTPETAWQTMGKVLQAADWGEILQTGDAVFFRRGDTFRMPENNLVVSVDGITFSAYGEGDKPILTASSESGVGSEKWELVHSDNSGKKIWKFHNDLRDVASVVLNDAEVATNRVYEFYGENGYESCTCDSWLMHDGQGVTLLGELLPLQDSLTEDYSFISRPNRGTMTDGVAGESGKGPLYLRCDAGNPGELFKSIEFSEFDIMGLVWLDCSDTVFDNISFRCNGNSYIKANTCSSDPERRILWTEFSGTVVQNCEFAYGGGSVMEYHYSDGQPFTCVQGDGIYTVVKDSTFRHNYFHDERSSPATYEWAIDDQRTGGGYYHVLDNVIVNSFGILLDSTSDSLKYLDSVIIRGNQIWNTGRMENDGYYYAQGSVVITDNHYGECIIEDNVFYGTENGYEDNALLHIAVDMGNCRLPTIRNNVYVQHEGRDFVYFTSKDASWAIDDPDVIKIARRMLLDTTSAFYVKKN